MYSYVSSSEQYTVLNGYKLEALILQAMKNAKDEKEDEYSDEEITSRDSIDSEESQEDLIAQAFARELQEKGINAIYMYAHSYNMTVHLTIEVCCYCQC